MISRVSNINLNSKMSFGALYISRNEATRPNLEKIVDRDTYPAIKQSLEEINKFSKDEDVFLYVAERNPYEENSGLKITLSDSTITFGSEIGVDEIKNKERIKSIFKELADKYVFTCKCSQGLVDRLMNRFSFDNED